MERGIFVPMMIPAFPDNPCAGGGSGTVTSVGITAPAIFAVTNSPITTAGAIDLALVNQSANQIFAGPTTGAAAVPTFRTVVAADLGTGTANSSTYLRGDMTWSAVSAGITGFIPSQNTAAPNNVINASRLLVDAATASADIVLQPKGTGAFLAQLPDGTTAAGNKRGTNAVDLQTSRTAATQVASGANSSILGGFGNTVSSDYATVAGGLSNSATGVGSYIGGGQQNTTNGIRVTIGGGQQNSASLDMSTIGGGLQNTASNLYSTVAGGYLNTAGGSRAFVGGGQQNNCTGSYSVIVGGINCINQANYGFVGGGQDNQADNIGTHKTICGGFSNVARNNYAFIGGGQGNSCLTSHSVVVGGGQNSANATGTHKVIVGGASNTASNNYTAIGGGQSNTASGQWATIAGGSGNTASGEYCAVIGGQGNTASGSTHAVVCGGNNNRAGTGQYSSVVGGNTNTANAEMSFIGGGSVNTTNSSAVRSTIGGGSQNVTQAPYATIAGGQSSTVAADNGSVIGGANNVVSSLGFYGSILGGANNRAQEFYTVASGHYSTAYNYGSVVHASGGFANVGGSCQTEEYVQRTITTTNTQTELTQDGQAAGVNPAASIRIENDSTYAFDILLTARRADADNESAAWRFTGCIDNNAGTVAFVGTPAYGVLGDDSGGVWLVNIAADNTNDRLTLLVTGENGKTIRWAATIRMIKITG